MIKDALRNEINALLDLLDDPDSSVYESVYKRFMQIGPATSEMLEDAWSMSLDDGYQKRIEYILDDISKNHALELSEKWLKNNPNDVLEGYLVFTQYQYPNINIEDVLNQLEALKINIWMELNENLTALETVRVFNHILFKVHRFEKDAAEISNPKYNYLNQVLQSKTYTYCSIALLYLILAKKLELPIEGVLYKGSPILCYEQDLKK
ncbi:MAG: transglutaminase family protein [Bacteroidales bacterium]|nr:transglutaminase family protein [Bacteroidales bacterium]